jgi:hypothetical protein
MYVPLFFLVSLFTWKTISTDTIVQGYVKEGVLYTIALIFVVHMIFSVNFTHVLDWKYDANTREISQDIEAIDGPILLGVHPFFQPSMEFYRRRFHLRKFGEMHVDGYRKEGVYDVFVIPTEDQGKIEQEHLQVVKEYLPSGAVVAVRR